MWLAVDPGETVGWSLWSGADLKDCGQDAMWEFVDQVADSCFCVGGDYEHANGPFIADEFNGLGAIICEDWALYPWVVSTGALDFDKCRTARAIGALTLIARLANIPFILQPASIKEGAVAAGAEEMFVSPLHENRHANDSIMHGVFYLATHNNKPPA